MPKQKIVIKVTMPNAKSRARAMALAAKATGVGSIGIAGDLKDRLEVVGEGVDAACLVHCLRKKLRCHAEILQVEEVKEKTPEEKKKEEEKKKAEEEKKKKAEEEKKKAEEAKKKAEENKHCPCRGPCYCAAGGYYHAPLRPMVLCEDPPAGVCRVM